MAQRTNRQNGGLNKWHLTHVCLLRISVGQYYNEKNNTFCFINPQNTTISKKTQHSNKHSDHKKKI